MDDFTWTPTHRAVELKDAQTPVRLPADGADLNEVFGAAVLLTHALDA
ncbi:hypothetical protein [Streptomyces sp. NPDC007905]